MAELLDARPEAAEWIAPARFGQLPALTERELPAFPGLLRALGPGIVWMALA